MAEHSIAEGPSLPAQPSIKPRTSTFTHSASMFVAAAVDVINNQELIDFGATTRTDRGVAAIMNKSS